MKRRIHMTLLICSLLLIILLFINCLTGFINPNLSLSTTVVTVACLICAVISQIIYLSKKQLVQ